MKNLWIVLLVCVVAVAAFVIGQRSSAPAAPASTAAAPMDEGAAKAREDATSAKPSSQPVRTFRGPNGLPHIIVYDPAKLPDNTDPAQVRAAVLEDMKNHPGNIERSYDRSKAQIQDIVAGKQPLPEWMLPKPAQAQPAR